MINQISTHVTLQKERKKIAILGTPQGVSPYQHTECTMILKREVTEACVIYTAF